MANSLNRNLKPGDKVVLVGNVEASIDLHTFGCSSFTAGTALSVIIGGLSYRADGYDIDAEKTVKRFSEHNGWTETENENL